MSWLFGGKPAVAVVPTDEVVPLHLFENSALVQGNNMAVSMVFDDILCPQKLRDSLEDLVKRDGWKRLGGRLRKNASGNIEWHIPAEFTAERPAITFNHVDHNMPASSHPAASQIPKPSSKPSVVGDPDLLEELAWAPGYLPGGIKDYLTEDLPALGLRVHSFTDITVVVIHWQHVAFDALGMKAVTEAWSAILHGNGDKVLTPRSYKDDPFDVLATGSRAPKEAHVLAERQIGIGGLLKWGFGYGYDMLVRPKENRMICIPESFWQTQLDKALNELRAEAVKNGEDPSKVFLTENDILTAWVIRCVVAPMDLPPNKLVDGSMVMSLRKAFEGDLLPPATENPYVGNALGWSNVLVSAGDVTSKPLSWLARQVRRAINEQGTRDQHEAYYALVRASKTGLPIVIFGEGDMAQIGFSNWTKAGLFHLDFSPARKDPGVKAGTPCRPSYIQENHGPIKPVNGFFIFGKDSRGNYWTSACKTKGEWVKLQEQMEKSHS